MFLFLQSTRVDWLAVEISRRQKDSAKNLQLGMWIRTISFAVGAHRPTSPFTHAISRTDAFKGQKLIESCCTVFHLKVSQKRNSRRRDFGLTCSRLRYKRCRTRIVASIEEHVQTVHIFIEPNSADSVHASRRGIKNHCCDVSTVDNLLYSNLPEGAEAMNSVLLVGKQEHGNFRFCGKEFRQDEDLGIHVTAKDNTERIQPITYEGKYGLTRKATADEIHQLRSVTRSLAWKHDLISQTVSEKFRARLKMLVFETCANAIILWNMQHLNPYVASIFLQIFLWTMQSS